MDEEDFIKAFEDVPAAQVRLEPGSCDLGGWLAPRVSGVCWAPLMENPEKMIFHCVPGSQQFPIFLMGSLNVLHVLTQEET